MAQVVGHVSEISGKFYIQGESGEKILLKAGDPVNMGDMVAGDFSNTQDNFIKFTLQGLEQEVTVAANEQLLFDEQMLAAAFEEMEAPAAGEPESEAVAGRFGDRTAGETDISTDLRDHAFGEYEVEAEGEGAEIVAAEEGESIVSPEPTSPESTPPPVSDTVPMLSVIVSSVQIIPMDESTVYELSYSKHGQNFTVSMAGGLVFAYADKDNAIADITDGNDLESTASFSGTGGKDETGNGIGIDTGEQGSIKDTININEAMVIKMDSVVDSAAITLKHTKGDHSIIIEAYNGTVKQGQILVDFDKHDSVTSELFDIGKQFDTLVIWGYDETPVGKFGFNVYNVTAFVGEYSYAYPITVESQSTDEGDLSNVTLADLPEDTMLFDDDGQIFSNLDSSYTVASNSSLTLVSLSQIEDEDLNEISGSVTDLGNNLTTDVTALIEIEGTAEADIITATDADEYIDAGESADEIAAGAGDDSIVFDSEDIIYGGDGNDTLILQNTSIDFSSFDITKLNNIETIDLRGDGGNSIINITLEDVLAVTDSNNTLHIRGDAGNDTVQLLNENGNNWSKSDITETVNDTVFDVYINSGDPTVTVYVQNEIVDEVIA